MPLGELLAAIEHLTKCLDLIGFVLYGRSGNRVGLIEAGAHELSHYIFTGPKFDTQLNDFAPRAANRHEASALRIEVTALQRLDCKISLRTLWARANWREDDLCKPPAWRTMGVALTPREERCVARLIRMVRQAAIATRC
jgi:hypothetical protein